MVFAVAMSLVYAPHESMLPDGREWGKAENIIFGTSQRLLWGLALAWVTYACHYGYGGRMYCSEMKNCNGLYYLVYLEWYHIWCIIYGI